MLRATAIAPESISIGGGIVLFLIGVKMIFPPREGGIFGGAQERRALHRAAGDPGVAGPSGDGGHHVDDQLRARRHGRLEHRAVCAWLATASILFVVDISVPAARHQRAHCAGAIDGHAARRVVRADVSRRPRKLPAHRAARRRLARLSEQEPGRCVPERVCCTCYLARRQPDPSPRLKRNDWANATPLDTGVPSTSTDAAKTAGHGQRVDFAARRNGRAFARRNRAPARCLGRQCPDDLLGVARSRC